LFGLPGVDSSKRWLIYANVGSRKRVSRNFRIEVCSQIVGSRCRRLAYGDLGE
jgi:hypothetical protein